MSKPLATPSFEPEGRRPGGGFQSPHPSYFKSDIAGRMGRDLDRVALQLAPIVGRFLWTDAPVTVSNVRAPVGAGSSNETFLFDVTWATDGNSHTRGLVLRICPQDFQLFMDPRMADQVRLLKVLHARGKVRVAEPLLYEAGDAPFGQPFFIMERLEGRVPISFPPYNSGGFLFEASVAERRRLWESAVDQLAEVARTPVEDVAFLAENAGDGDFDKGLQWWLDYSGWAGVRELPALASMEAWLMASKPTASPPGLSWGDARIGNMMFADDFTVAGVMDWEQLSLGGALLDLGWWLFFDRFHSDTLGLKRLDGLGTREETLARWEGITGIKPTDIDWYERLAGYKLAVITGRKTILEGLQAPPQQSEQQHHYPAQRTAAGRAYAGGHHPLGSFSRSACIQLPRGDDWRDESKARRRRRTRAQGRGHADHRHTDGTGGGRIGWRRLRGAGRRAHVPGAERASQGLRPIHTSRPSWSC